MNWIRRKKNEENKGQGVTNNILILLFEWNSFFLSFVFFLSEVKNVLNCAKFSLKFDTGVERERNKATPDVHSLPFTVRPASIEEHWIEKWKRIHSTRKWKTKNGMNNCNYRHSSNERLFLIYSSASNSKIHLTPFFSRFIYCFPSFYAQFDKSFVCCVNVSMLIFSSFWMWGNFVFGQGEYSHDLLIFFFRFL